MLDRIAMAKYSAGVSLGGGLFGSLTVVAIHPETIGGIISVIGFALASLAVAWSAKLATAFADALRIWARGKADAAVLRAKGAAEVDRIKIESQTSADQAEAWARVSTFERWLEQNQETLLGKLGQLSKENRTAIRAVRKNRLLISQADLEKQAREAETLDLTRALAKQLGLASVIRSNDPDAPPIQDRSSLTVLVIEDDASTRQVFWSLLRRERFQVLIAVSLEEARTRLQLKPGPNAVLLDLRLEDGPGEDLIDEIQAADPAIRIVVLTGLEESPRLAAIRPRVAALLRKPVDDFEDVCRALEGGPPDQE